MNIITLRGNKSIKQISIASNMDEEVIRALALGNGLELISRETIKDHVFTTYGGVNKVMQLFAQKDSKL